MHVLFVHQNFPAQFRYLAPRLIRDHGWRCTFVTEQPERSLPGVEKILYKARGGASKANHVCTRNFENTVAHAHGVYEAMKARPDIRPDLVVAHTGFGSSLFLPFLYDAPIINFLEYFYHPGGQSLGFRPELPVTEMDLLRVKCRNAMMFLDLENCDRGWTPTYYQRDYFPRAYHDKIAVIFDGIDTDIYHRKANPERRIGDKGSLSPDVRVVTYVARGLEMMRGFDIFMKAAKRIYEQFPDVVFVVVGTDRVSYGGDLRYIKAKSLRHHVLAQDRYDPTKFRFTGYVSEETLAEILSISDLHIYLTEPFITSWSMVDALACGVPVLASDQKCVREYITPGVNGLLGDFFDYEGLARQAVAVLKDPAAYRPLAEAGRQMVEEKYSVHVALPRLKALFEEVAAKRREPSVRAELLVRPGTLALAGNGEATGDSLQSDAGGSRAEEAPAPAFRMPAEAARDPVLHQAIRTLHRLSEGKRTVLDWIQVSQSYSGPAPRFARLGPWNHAADLARLMNRLVEWKAQVVLDLGSREGGTLFLWTRVATDEARLIAAGLPGRVLPPERVPFFQAMARRRQTIRCLPGADDPEVLARQVQEACEGRLIDFMFMDGLRPYDQLKADFLRYRRQVRKDGLIAWDGLKSLLPAGPAEAGGQRLWEEMKPLYPHRAEYLEGLSTPRGGIAVVRV
jgi:glycosyltransferase involved in cell wall biosynthesis